MALSTHISATTRTCRFGLWNIKKIRPILSKYVVQILGQACVISKQDYCNALLAGLPASATNLCRWSWTR